MDGPDEALLEVLPQAAADAMRKAFGEHRGTYEFTKCFNEACDAIGYPSRMPYPPLVSELTPVQHALVQLVADEPFDAPSHIPTTVKSRRRWLGLDAPGLLEQVVRFTDPQGKDHETPLWYALHVLPRRGDNEEPKQNRMNLMRRFSIEEQLRILAEVADEEGGYSVDPWDAFSGDLDQVKGDGADWLPGFADTLAAKPGFIHAYRFPVFLSLVRAGLHMKPAWDRLLPVASHEGARPYMFECVRGIPEERRAQAIVNACRSEPGGTVIAGILVEEFPSRALAEYIIAQLPTEQGRVKKWLIPKLEAAGQKSPEVAAIVGSIRKPTKTIALTCIDVVKPKSHKELSKSQQAQIAKAGKLYDGMGVPAARRVSSDMQDEQNFAGTLELRAIADAKGKLAYEAYTYNGDSGTIFKAGTTTVVAEIMQGGMECKNEALGDALESALEADPVAPAKKPAAKKPIAKKAPAKKPAAKKPAAKKSPKKKPAAKKPAKRK